MILITAFICDFLCIHPFNDGNGRMSRLLTVNVDLQSANHEFGRADRHYGSALLSFSRKRRNSR
ncbi:Fic family protein [Hominenteromicrobium mulieris]|uniref:Fic family protein n=1 Tax=Hominenteromicrobium TaxID=3073575 RepID=UPI0037706746